MLIIHIDYHLVFPIIPRIILLSHSYQLFIHHEHSWAILTIIICILYIDVIHWLWTVVNIQPYCLYITKEYTKYIIHMMVRYYPYYSPYGPYQYIIIIHTISYII